MMKTVNADGTSYNGFVWPLEVGAKVVAPDWNDDAKCGGGLHGLHNGIGSGALLDWSDDAVWIVASVKKAEIVDLGGKIKVPRCKIVHVGNRESATRFLSDAGIVGPIVGGTATAGYEGTAMAGDWGTATAGDGGTATAGKWGTAMVGDGGTATAGDGGTATAGYEGTATAGKWGTATAGKWGTATAGYEGTATAGDGGTATAGDGGTATAGDGGTATAGKWGTATAGDGGTATAGDGGTATAGYEGTATAGDKGTLIIRRWDGKRYRTVVGYIGENGLEPNTPYKLNDAGEFVKADG